VDAKPQLEIFADDVKCTHGATVGRLDEDALYYLRSRGLAASDAEKMLTLAFARQITETIDYEPLREETGRLLEQRLDEWKQKQEA
jgi:Fe-S cluster assembly protein SufD